MSQLQESMRNIYSEVSCEPPEEQRLNKLKREFEDAYLAASKLPSEDDKNSFKARFTYLIPKGGIVHNNVQRLLLSSGIEKYQNKVPLAILVESVE